MHNNQTAVNAGRHIMSQGSGSNKKAGVPKANEVMSLKERERKNYVHANVNKAAFEMKPPEAKANQES